MGLERLQAGEEGGDSGCAALWRDAYIFHNDYKNSPKNTTCTTHCVVHAAGGEGGIRPAALGQCRRQPGELGNDTLYRFRPSWGRSLRVPFPNHHFNKNIPPFGRIFLLERVMGLEPTISAWKANVLPLHYTRVLSCKWCGRRDLNSYAFRHWNLNPARLPIPPRPQAYYSDLVTRRRFELRTP